MMSLSIAEAKARFSGVVRAVESGEDVIVTRGVSKVPVAALIPITRYKSTQGRTLGLARSWGEIRFGAQWAMSDQELLES
ncbi:MAG: type II toxin-antitoxin system prevent-host-death family antitoxin [Bifidobacteriaceae bacterium]|jgi:prevent-host-death family protein|nr:type II toxin-antitoxin system prevent-host-death family antitoxin [Bifidobacteriaceae bacterium]